MHLKRIVLALSAALLLAQTPEPRPQRSRLRADLDFLTSDVLAGRLSLTPQADVAARYIAAEFQKAGLKPVRGDSYLQEFPLVAYRPGARQLILTRGGQSKTFHSDEGFIGGFYRDVDIRAAVAFAGYGITAPEYGYDDYANIDVKGKVVVIFDHEPQENDPKSIFNGTGHTLHALRWMKLRNARSHGAVAVLIANEPLRTHGAGGATTRPARQAGEQADVRRAAPQIARASAPPQSIDDADAIPGFSIGDGLLAELLAPVQQTPAQIQKSIDSDLKPRSQTLNDMIVALRSENAEQKRGVSLNAVGLLEGSDPVLKTETVLLMAHYDHLGVQNGMVYRGANDNASGTAAVMELARLFAHASPRPKRSLLFIVFGSEEELMLGSFYYVAHPLRPLESTRAALNLDMIGRDEAHIPQSEGVIDIPPDTSNLINLVGTFYSPDLLAIIRRANTEVDLQLDTKYDADHTLNTLFRCDHLPFLIAHIPAVWLFGGFHPGYHEPVDTVEKLNFPKIEKVIALAYRTALSVAVAQATPRFLLRE